MRLLYRVPPPLIDVQLIAWHHMINDPYLVTYTMNSKGQQCSQWVNPKLGFKRKLEEMVIQFQDMATMIQDALFGPLTDLAKVFQDFANSFEQLGLEPSFEDESPVD